MLKEGGRGERSLKEQGERDGWKFERCVLDKRLQRRRAGLGGGGVVAISAWRCGGKERKGGGRGGRGRHHHLLAPMTQHLRGHDPTAAHHDQHGAELTELAFRVQPR